MLVLGAEGDGMRRLVRETCDELCGLAMPGTMESLNVSAAATLALYELTRPAMTAFSPERAAAALMGARRVPKVVRRPLGPLPSGARPSTMAEGVAAQLALARLSDSAAPAGFKIGATAARMQVYLGLDGPAAGFMPRAGLHASGSTLSLDAILPPRAWNASSRSTLPATCRPGPAPWSRRRRPLTWS